MKNDPSELEEILMEFIEVYEDIDAKIWDFNHVYEAACEVLGLEPKEIV